MSGDQPSTRVGRAVVRSPASRSCRSGRRRSPTPSSTRPPAATPDPTYPLEIVFCPDCALVQLGYILPAEPIFGEDYPYFSSFSDMFTSARRRARRASDRRPWPRRRLVRRRGREQRRLPAAQLRRGRCAGPRHRPGARAGGGRRADRRADDRRLLRARPAAERMVAEHGHADVIIANNVMAHVPDLNDFVGGLCDAARRRRARHDREPVRPRHGRARSSSTPSTTSTTATSRARRSTR